ncbi:MAG: ABC transporter permease [Treponema sp.]|nr:ABC transporter permease [Spirochaetia bacterium]MDY5123907.1 ABC transporter permease [Treponema sp.]
MIETILIEGLIYGIMVLGLFISYRTLNFCDMTVDGAFPMGGCILATCLMNGIPPFIAIVLAFLGGCLTGLITTLLYTKLRIPDLLAGILMMTMLYSVNLRIMSNRANISFLRINTTFSNITRFVEDKFPMIPAETGILVFLVIFIIIFKSLLDLFFHTDLGLTMGALGSNQQMVVSQGVNPQIVRGIGVCFGDGLAALSGAFAAMYNGFADVGSGSGVIVSGLASLMLGEFIIRSNKIGWQTLRVLLGSIIYRGLMCLARMYGHYIHLTANDLKLITGLLIIICLIIANLKGKGNFKQHLKRPPKTGNAA